MPTLKQVQDTIDNYIVTFWPLMQSKQSQFPENRFFQGLQVFSTLPLYSSFINGKKKPNKLSFKPSDRDTNWVDFGIPGLNQNISIPCDIQCDEYLGPAGNGYVVILSFEYDTGLEVQVWRKALQSGPEVWREYDWAIIVL